MAVVRTDILEERIASIISVTRIGKLVFLRRMASSGILHHVALVRTEASEKLSASFIRVTRIGELGTTLAVTSD
jgi:hypothetical protein